ncbi:MAG: S9 family peptidase [Chitinophagaceae bacterium]|nr:S9 family peptidase [Chitinophagaceae bacterium]
MRKIFPGILLCLNLAGFAQNKKPLDHSVYDGWQSIGEKKISNDGKWIVYVINVQEGDGVLQIQSADQTYRKNIDRGYNIFITDDSRFLICKIKPLYADVRQARIKKKTPDNFPKDSLAIIELGKDSIFKTARVKSFRAPEKNNKWVAWHLEKPLADTSKKTEAKDSLTARLDSLRQSNEPVSPELEKRRKKITNPPVIKNDDHAAGLDADDEGGAASNYTEGTTLIVYNLQQNTQHTIPFVGEYHWSENGNILLLESAPSQKDSMAAKTVSVFRSVEDRFDTIMKGGNDFKNYAIDKEGYRVAFIAERDSSAKSLRKFYKLWYWQNGQDSALMIADKNTPGVPVGWGISENAMLGFSRSGKRLFAGTAPIPALKDTSLVDIDLVKVDVWNYKDDYLQTVQLKNLDKELKRSYLATINTENKTFVQLADKEVPDVLLSEDGDGELAAGISDVSYRVASQWEGRTQKDIYAINPDNGSKQLVKMNVAGNVSVSAAGKFILWYDQKAKQYFTWRKGAIQNISAKVAPKLYVENFDMPNDPYPYGIMGWTGGDLAVLVYDRYDIWQLDPLNVVAPVNITGGEGRKNKIVYRYIKTDAEELYIAPTRELLLSAFNETSKYGGLSSYKLEANARLLKIMSGPYAIGNSLVKAKNAATYIYTKESYTQSPDLYVNNNWAGETKLTAINPQQSMYSWGTAELFNWKAYNGKQATGIVYKPENFDPKKKYPVICYFYEKLSDGLFTYIPPAPTPSRLNISFFVSRGYIVFAPDIEYMIGHPGKSAYNYIVSGARALVKKGWADSTKMGLQGQSWGGYQTAYLITQTRLFKAAWAGAPVSNMTSAYGGIRWESGMNRQFQYERTQSRIGATLWEKPQLYMENSPLFYLPKVATPLVIMHNDNDGAVPWYQGIELFTAMRRLNKPVWMLNYNGEAHNLVERKNRKDIQVREQQFFDWLLKGERPAEWLRDGVPAVMKGKNWGLEDE